MGPLRVIPTTEPCFVRPLIGAGVAQVPTKLIEPGLLNLKGSSLHVSPAESIGKAQIFARTIVKGVIHL